MTATRTARDRRLAYGIALGLLGCGGSHASAPPAAESGVAACDESTDTAPKDLSCTGLYADASQKTLAPGVRPYAPSTPLWSDGAEKSRYVLLPDGQPIDASDPNAWSFPVGTKAWKDFSAQGKKIETRFFWKATPTKWLRATYVWSDDETKATRNDDGVPNARGTGFDVPKTEACDGCHEGRKDRLLGFDAIGLGAAGASGVTLATLVAEGRFATAPPVTSIAFGDAKSAPAFAWLHVNCGAACHNANENAKANVTGMRLALTLDGAWGVSGADILKTTVGAKAEMPANAGETRIVPGRADDSLLVKLITVRGDPQQMPPVGSNAIDATGVATIRAWIDALPVPIVHRPPMNAPVVE